MTKWTRYNDYFYLEEFFPPDMMSHPSFASKLDKRVIEVLTCIRNELRRPITVNNWHLGPADKSGRYTQRGVRSFSSLIGAKYSQHKFGRAADFTVADMSAESVRQFIKREGDRIAEKCKVMNITLEEKTDWVHLDIRDYYDKGPVVRSFNP